jgi:two-component system response regulator YesN
MRKSNISDRVVEYVLNCSTKDFQTLTVSELARIFGVNRCYLSRKFKGDKDFTLCEFLAREKLFRAVGILKKDSRLTIKDLSEKLGFANSNYFIRIFKRHFGTSPGRYREWVNRKLTRKIV